MPLTGRLSPRAQVATRFRLRLLLSIGALHDACSAGRFRAIRRRSTFTRTSRSASLFDDDTVASPFLAS